MNVLCMCARKRAVLERGSIDLDVEGCTVGCRLGAECRAPDIAECILITDVDQLGGETADLQGSRNDPQRRIDGLRERRLNPCTSRGLFFIGRLWQTIRSTDAIEGLRTVDDELEQFIAQSLRGLRNVCTSLRDSCVFR